MQGVSGQSFHDVTLSRLVSEGDGRYHVSTEVNTQDGNGAEWQWNVSHDEQKERRDLWDVTCQRVGDGLLQVVKDQPAYSTYVIEISPMSWVTLQNSSLYDPIATVIMESHFLC